APSRWASSNSAFCWLSSAISTRGIGDSCRASRHYSPGPQVRDPADRSHRQNLSLMKVVGPHYRPGTGLACGGCRRPNPGRRAAGAGPAPREVDAMRPRLVTAGALTAVAGAVWVTAVFSQSGPGNTPPADRPTSSYTPTVEPDFDAVVKKM